MTHPLVQVEFAGSTLLGQIYKGQPYVAMKPIVEGIGLDWDRQQIKLKGHPVLAKQLTPIRGVTGADGKHYKMTCLPLSRLPFWLATINPSKVKESISDRVILFQEKAADVLADAFLAHEDRKSICQTKRIASTVMCRILHDTLLAVGKDPKGYDYATEHRLVNHCITGVFGAINEDDLTIEQLKLQEELRMQNAVWIGQGKTYQQRRTELETHATIWIAKQRQPERLRTRRTKRLEKAA